MFALRHSLVLCIIFFGTAGNAATDVTVEISSQYMEQATTLALDRFVTANVPVPVVWTADVSRLNYNAISVRAEGRSAGVNVVNVNLEVVIDCGGEEPPSFDRNSCDPQSYISIMIENFSVITAIGPLPEEQREALEQAITNEANNIAQDITCALNDGLMWANTRNICPSVDVSVESNLKAQVDLVNGCINGQTRRDSCVAPRHGRGRLFTCENGLWRYVSGSCIEEPRVPPGGHRP